MQRMFAQLVLQGGPEVRLKPLLAALGSSPNCPGSPAQTKVLPTGSAGQTQGKLSQTPKQSYPVAAKLSRIPVHEIGSKVYPFKKETGF